MVVVHQKKEEFNLFFKDIQKGNKSSIKEQKKFI